MAPLNLAQELGIAPRYTDATNVGGSSFMFHVAHARAAIAAGACEVALIAYGSTQRLVGRGSASVAGARPVGGAVQAADAGDRLRARRVAPHARVRHDARAARRGRRLGARWAQLNPKAYAREPLSVEDVLGVAHGREPADGPRLLPRDRRRRRDRRHLGGARAIAAQAAGARARHAARRIRTATSPACPTSSARAPSAPAPRRSREAGLSPADVDCAQLYDAFTITPILFLEDLGFCAKGEGGPFAASGATDPGGALPMNTSGGGLSYCHPGMYGLLAIVEAVRQLRGECGERQVEGCEVAVAHGNGGVLSSQARSCSAARPRRSASFTLARWTSN